jgi:hypothetical protein
MPPGSHPPRVKASTITPDTLRVGRRLPVDDIGEREAEMAAQPGIVQRTEQPYVAIRAFVTMHTFGEVVPGLHPEVRRWLRTQGVPPAGQPFCKYNVIDMDRQLEVEAGFPVAAQVTGEGQVLAAVHARWRAVGLPPGVLSRRARPGHERVENRARIQAR